MINKAPYIIAEISGNHGGDLSTAIDLIEAAVDCGCNAVKFQLYAPADMPDYADNALLYERLAVPRDWLAYMFEHARYCEIPLFASVFAPWAIDALELNDCPAYKLASPESTRLKNGCYEAMVKLISLTGKPLMVSSGLNDWERVSREGRWILYCKAGYPATIDEIDLAMMKRCDGFSDHTEGIQSSLAMIGAGARIIEKHFGFGEDDVDAFALGPKQMRLLCKLASK